MRQVIEKEASKALGAVLAVYVKANGEVEVDDTFKAYSKYKSPLITNARCQDCMDYPKRLTERGVVVIGGKEWVYADIDFEDLSALVRYTADR